MLAHEGDPQGLRLIALGGDQLVDLLLGREAVHGRGRLLLAHPAHHGLTGIGRVAQAVEEGAVDALLVALTDDEIVLAMRWRGMHRSRPRLERDMIAENDRYLLRQEGVLERQVLEHASGKLQQHPAGLQTIASQTGFAQVVSQ